MGKKSVLSSKDGFEHDYDYIDRLNEQMEQRESGLKEVALDKIKVKENIRVSYEKIEEMASSIKEKGLLQPITITPIADGYFEIVFGHRRYKGYCHLNEQEPMKYLKIQAIVKDTDSFNEDEIKEVQLIENIQRDNLKPLELKGALEYFRSTGLSNKAIAERLGKKEGYVKQIFSSIKTIKQNPDLEELIQSDVNVTLADIQEIRPLPFKEQVNIITEKIEGKITTIKELRERVFHIKDILYHKGKFSRQQKSSFDIFSEKNGEYRVKSFRYNPHKTSAEDKGRLLTVLNNLIEKINGDS